MNSSKSELHRKTTGSFVFTMPDLKDSVEVLYKVLQLEEIYDSYTNEQYIPSNTLDINAHTAIFYIEALYNYSNYVTEPDGQLIDPNPIETEYTLEYNGASGEALVSESSVFALLDEIMAYDQYPIAPTTDLDLFASTESLLRIKTSRLRVHSGYDPCEYDDISTGESYRAIPFEDCNGQSSSLSGWWQLTLSTGYGYYCGGLGPWLYDVHQVDIADRVTALMPNVPASWDYKPTRRFYDPITGQVTPALDGSQTTHYEHFWGGHEIVAGPQHWRNANECLHEADLKYWRDEAKFVMDFERPYLGFIVKSYVYGRDDMNQGPRHYLVLTAGKPGGPAPTN